MSKLSVLVLVSILFVLNVKIFSDEAELIIKKANEITDFSKPNYDRKTAVALYDSVIDNEKYHLYYRLEACFTNGILFLYRCKPEDENKVVSKKYLEKYLVLCDKYYTADLPLVKMYLANMSKEPAMEVLRLYFWSRNIMLTDLLNENLLISPNKTNEEEIKGFRLSVCERLFISQDSNLIRLRGLLKDEANSELKDLVKEMGVNLDAPASGVKYRKELLTKLINSKYKEELKPVESDKPTNVDEKKGATKEKEAGDTLKEDPIFKEMEKVYAKRREWVEKDKEVRMAFVNYLEKIQDLSKTEKGQKEVLEELEKKKVVWQSSPFEEEVIKVINRLKKKD